MNVYHNIGHLEFKLFIVDVIQGRCIKATCVNQILLNTFYYLYTVKTSGWHNIKTLKPSAQNNVWQLADFGIIYRISELECKCPDKNPYKI